MGIDYAYFVAPNDATAAEAESRKGGPLGWRQIVGHRKVGLLKKEPVFEELGPAYDGFATRGYEPVVVLARLEALLTGTTADAVLADPRSGGSPTDAEPPPDGAVLTLTDSLRDALVAASDSEIREAVKSWMQTEEVQILSEEEGSFDDHLAFVSRLRDLARRAAERGERLYCYYEV